MKKRFFATVLILALAATLCPAALAEGKLSTPSDLAWGDGYPAMFWEPGDNYTGIFQLTVYKDDSLLAQGKFDFGSNGGSYDLNFFLAENSVSLDSGVYHFTVQNLMDLDSDSVDDSDVAVSPKWAYTAPDAQLAPPTDPAWDFPLHTWRRGTDDKEQGALLQLCFCESEDGDYQTVSNVYCVIGRDTVRLPVDTWALEKFGEGYYKFRIINLTFDPAQTQSSPWSAYSEPYYHDGSSVELCEHWDCVYQNKKEATCTETGYTGDYVCVKCKEVMTYGDIIPALGHDLDADGVCQRCGEQVADRAGTLGQGSGALSWTYTAQTGAVALKGVIPVGETVFVACYQDGRFTGVKTATGSSPTVEVGTTSDRLRLFWLDGRQAPKCQAVGFTLAQ